MCSVLATIATGGLPGAVGWWLLIICVGDVWFFGYLCWRWAGREVYVPRPVATLGLPPLCFVSREYDGCSFSSPRFRVPDQVRRCVRGMRVEPRFRGLMARTVLLVYTLFELLGSWVRV